MSESSPQTRNDAIVLIEPSQADIFEKRLAALNKKAVAYGLDPIKVVSAKEVIYERKLEYLQGDQRLYYLSPVRSGDHPEHPVRVRRIELEYPVVKLGNWRVIGKLEAVENGNLTFTVSHNVEDVAALRDRAAHPIECEHCKTHRYRKDGYLLRDMEHGGYKEVGSSCLQDFTGIDPAVALFLTQMYKVIRDAEDDYEAFARGGTLNAIDTRRFLADVSFLIEHKGFVSASKGRDMHVEPTYSEARYWVKGVQPSSLSLRIKHSEQLERHLATADAIRNWIAAKPEESSFDRNVKLLLQADAIALDRKHLAFAAAAVPMYLRTLAEEAEARKPSVHIGTPGQKMTAILTVDRVVPIETQYGTSSLVLMRDQSDNKLKWKTSACPYEITNGTLKTIEASFKIKAHDNYKGTAQTTITHLKISSQESTI